MNDGELTETVRVSPEAMARIEAVAAELGVTADRAADLLVLSACDMAEEQG